MAMTIAGWGDILEPILQKVSFDYFLEYPSLVPELFNTVKSKKYQETYLDTIGSGGFQEFNGTVQTSDMTQGYKQVITNKQYTDSYDVQKFLYDTEQYPIMEKRAKALARNGRYKRETDGFGIFNHAFDTTYVGSDDLGLCDSAHTSPVSGVANQSNTGTSALNYSNFVEARRLMKAFKDLAGRPIGINPNAVLCHTYKETAARECFESNFKNDGTTTQYTIDNIIRTTYKPKLYVSEYLTDTTNWFLIAEREMKENLHWQNFTPFTTFQDFSNTTLVMKMVGYMAYGFGFEGWQWIYGNNATT